MNPSCKERNTTMDLLKFIFSLVIVWYHYYINFLLEPGRGYPNGYLAVEFFFISSGCLLANSAEKRNNNLNIGKDTWEFIKHKFIGLVPEVYVAWLLFFSIQAISLRWSIYQIIKNIVGGIPELLFIHYVTTGKNLFCCNGVYWYISALLVGCEILYPLLK